MEHDRLLFVKKYQPSQAKTLYLAAMAVIYIKVSFVNFLSQCGIEEKTFKKI
jgi:hypothetical protein